MRQLNYDEINKLWQQKADMNLEEAPILVESFGASQPAMLSYLLASGDNILSPEERQITFLMGTLIWYVVSELHENSFQVISLEQLIGMEEKNFTMLEYLSGEPDSEFMATVTKIMDKYNQNTLLHYVIERMIDEPNHTIEQADSHMGMMVIYLKSLIDCIDLTVS